MSPAKEILDMSYAHAKFGIATGAGFQNLDDEPFNIQMGLLKDLNVHWLRTSIPWKLVQGKPDDWNWLKTDRLVNACKEEGIKIIATLSEPPNWAKESITHIDNDVQPPFDIPAYATFAEVLAERYGHEGIQAMELGNEPTLGTDAWPLEDESLFPAKAAMYAEILKQTYPTIKNADPRIRVLVAGLIGGRSVEFLNGIYANGGKGFFNGVCFHPYSYPRLPSETETKGSWNNIKQVYEVMKQNGDEEKRIWITEIGAPSVGNPGASEQNEADIIEDAYKLWFKYDDEGIVKTGPLCVFRLVDKDDDPDHGRNGDSMGLVNEDLTHKLAYETYKALALPGPHK